MYFEPDDGLVFREYFGRKRRFCSGFCHCRRSGIIAFAESDMQVTGLQIRDGRDPLDFAIGARFRPDRTSTSKRRIRGDVNG